MFEHQKIDAPPHTKVCGLIGARFLDAQSVDHILKNVVSSKTTVFECAQKSKIFDIGRHFDIILQFL